MFMGEIFSGSQVQVVMTPEGHLTQGQCLEKLSVCHKVGGRCHEHLMGRGHGNCSTSYSTEDISPQRKDYLVANVHRAEAGQSWYEGKMSQVFQVTLGCWLSVWKASTVRC